MVDRIDVRNLCGAEAHMVVDWARREGWNPGLHDAACFYAADPEGFLVSLHDGEPAAVISVVRYDASYAFLGLYICRPELRGQGYGMRVWKAGIEHAGGRTIGLDGVPDQQENYARSGFRLAWRNRRYQGVGGGERDPGLVDLDEIAFGRITAFDYDVFEADRRRFLRFWVAQPDAVRLASVRGEQLTGWGMMRRCVDGHKIGPLLAEDIATAERLLDGLLAEVPGETVYLDVPEPNHAAVRAAEARGMTVSFETARMYAGTPPDLNLAKIWGITTFELG